jgi:hypothetical protein
MNKKDQFYHGYRFPSEIISHAVWLYLRCCLSFRDIWATLGSVSSGPPIWDVVADYLRRSDTARVIRLKTPKLKNVVGNPGIA